MAEFNSAEFAAFNTPEGNNVRDWGGRVRMAYWSVPAIVGLAQDDTVLLTKLPAKARVLEGRIEFGAYGASVTLDIGVKSPLVVDKYLNGADISAAGELDIANDRALNMGQVTTAAEDVIATFLDANPSDVVTMSGWLLYVID